MRLEIRRRLRNHRVFWVNGERVLVTRGYTVVEVRADGAHERVGRYRAPWTHRLLAASRVFRHGLRLGFHNLLPLADGSLVGIVKRTLVRMAPGEAEFRVAGRIRWGNKPGLKGFCTDDSGRIYYAEYVNNPDRRLPIGVFRSDDGGCSYRLRYEFPAGRVRHIHFVQWDPYARCLWLGTGDRDAECMLFNSKDQGATWNLVGGGSQQWRAVGVAFTAEALFWGTDAGSDTGTTPNYIMRWDRATEAIARVQQVQGPCHGNAVLANGTVAISTGVEGGANEQDRLAHLWIGEGGSDWQEVAAWKKDAFPPIVQFGVVHFPHGIERQDTLHFTQRALAPTPECYCAATLVV